MDVEEIVKAHLKNSLNLYMKEDAEIDKERLLLQDAFIDDNKDIYRLVGIIR